MYRMKRVGFGDFNPGQETMNTIVSLAKYFSVSECLSIVWRAVSNGSTMYVDGTCTKKRAANSVISSIRRHCERATKENWTVSRYYWPSELPKSVAATYVYEKVLRLESDSFTTKPSIELLRQGALTNE